MPPGGCTGSAMYAAGCAYLASPLVALDPPRSLAWTAASSCSELPASLVTMGATRWTLGARGGTPGPSVGALPWLAACAETGGMTGCCCLACNTMGDGGDSMACSWSVHNGESRGVSARRHSARSEGFQTSRAAGPLTAFAGTGAARAAGGPGVRAGARGRLTGASAAWAGARGMLHKAGFLMSSGEPAVRASGGGAPGAVVRGGRRELASLACRL